MTTILLLNFFLGLLTSFLGTVPLGLVNLSVVNTTIRKNFRSGFILALAASIVEIVHSFFAVHFGMLITDFISGEYHLLFDLGIALSLLGIGLFFFFKKVEENEFKGKKKRLKLSSFMRGALMGLLNPQALPFWIFVISYLQMEHLTVLNMVEGIISFLIGVSIGKLLCLTLYGYVSTLIVKRLTTIAAVMNRVMAVIFILMSVFQGVKTFL